MAAIERSPSASRVARSMVQSHLISNIKYTTFMAKLSCCVSHIPIILDAQLASLCAASEPLATTLLRLPAHLMQRTATQHLSRSLLGTKKLRAAPTETIYRQRISYLFPDEDLCLCRRRGRKQNMTCRNIGARYATPFTHEWMPL